MENETFEKVINVLKHLDEQQVAYLREQYNLPENFVDTITDAEIDEIYDDLCDAEVEEAVKNLDEGHDGELSEEGEIIVSLVDAIGNCFAVEEDIFADDADDKEN